MDKKEQDFYKKVCKEIGLSKFDTQKYIKAGAVLYFKETEKQFYISSLINDGYSYEEAAALCNSFQLVEIDGVKYRIDFIL